MNETYKAAARSVLTTHRLLDGYLIPYLEKVAKEKNMEISMIQYYALAYIHDNQGCSLSAVSESLGFSLSAASKLVDILVEKNYLTRDIDKSDRRRLVLNMSSEVTQMFDDYQQTIYDSLAELFTDLQMDDILRLNEIAKKLVSLSSGKE